MQHVASFQHCNMSHRSNIATCIASFQHCNMLHRSNIATCSIVLNMQHVTSFQHCNMSHRSNIATCRIVPSTQHVASSMQHVYATSSMQRLCLCNVSSSMQHVASFQHCNILHCSNIATCCIVPTLQHCLDFSTCRIVQIVQRHILSCTSLWVICDSFYLKHYFVIVL